LIQKNNDISIHKMIELTELIIEHILKYLDPNVCCKNFNELNIMLANKYLKNFYTTHFTYKFHNDFVKTLFPHKTKKILKTSIDRVNGKLCCKCARLDSLEKDRLEYILQRYSNLASKYNRFDVNVKYKNEELSMLNVHFDFPVRLTNFIIKMDKINSNMWFDPVRCCNGSGCNIEIVI